MIAAHAVLRAATADKHHQVDHAFSHFDLGNRQSYGSFLIAHARVLGAVEGRLAAAPTGFPQTRTRLAHLAGDLEGFAQPLPDPMPMPYALGDAALWGMLYVAEGSRLGGGVLAARVGQGLPRSFLAAVHLKGEWRTLLAALDAAALSQPPSWSDAMAEGARRTFDLYMDSAGIEAPMLA